MKHTVPIQSLSQPDRALTGGKGFSICRLASTGFNVPQGFIILTSAFDAYISRMHAKDDIETLLATLQYYKSYADIRRISKTIKSLIINSSIPKEIAEEIWGQFTLLGVGLVAVRSSSTNEDSKFSAWAGLFDTFTYTTYDSLLDNIKLCWASLYSERALEYAVARNTSFLGWSMAVIVQQMIDCEFSGVVFTVDPVSTYTGDLIIEAGKGQCQQVVSGRVTPETYTVRKADIKITGKQSAESSGQMRLGDSKILKLAQLALQIERSFGAPQDIEWAYSGKNFYMLQSRPITTAATDHWQMGTLDANTFHKIYSSKNLPFLYEDLISNNYINWHNLIICIDNGDMVFADKDALIRTQEIGAGRTVKEMRSFAERLDILTSKAINESLRVHELQAFTRKTADRYFSLFGSILNLYGLFDHCYWDKVYAMAEADPKAKETILFVQNYKNLIREKLDKIFFEPDGLFPWLLRTFAIQFKLEDDEIKWYRQAELIALFSGARLTKEKIDQRKRCCVFYNDRLNNTTFT